MTHAINTDAAANEAAATAPAKKEFGKEYVVERITKYLAVLDTKKAYDARKTAADNIIKLNETRSGSFTMETVDLGRKYHDNIETQIINAIARFNGVKFCTQRDATAKYVFVGLPSDITTTQHMVDTVNAHIKAETSSHLKELREAGEKVTAKIHADFRRKFAASLGERLEKLSGMVVSHREKQGLEPHDQSAELLTKAEEFVAALDGNKTRALSHGITAIKPVPAAPAEAAA